MTYKGAINQLYEMRDNTLMPEFFKPYFDKIIETLTDDVRENVRGEWQKEYLVEDLGIMLYVCDKCAEPTVKKTNFCPNCGADMRHRS